MNFDNLPLNTKQIYIMGIAPGGCKVYIPSSIMCERIQAKQKEELQDYLNTLSVPYIPPNEPMRA